MSASESHRLSHQLHRGQPTNSSINLPVSQRLLQQKSQQNNEDGAIPVALIGRPAMNTKNIAPASKLNGLVNTGRRLPNLAMFYAGGPNFRGRQFSTESQQPLNDSTNSSIQRAESNSIETSPPPTHQQLQNRNCFNLSNTQPFIFVNRK